ncbi:MAG: hypothetical protein ACI8VZ_001319 [Candidatus Paceibacteria bacterium]
MMYKNLAIKWSNEASSSLILLFMIHFREMTTLTFS